MRDSRSSAAATYATASRMSQRIAGGLRRMALRATSKMKTPATVTTATLSENSDATRVHRYAASSGPPGSADARHSPPNDTTNNATAARTRVRSSGSENVNPGAAAQNPSTSQRKPWPNPDAVSSPCNKNMSENGLRRGTGRPQKAGGPPDAGGPPLNPYRPRPRGLPIVPPTPCRGPLCSN